MFTSMMIMVNLKVLIISFQDLGLYYHGNTQCYYYYSEETKSFAFHSYPEATPTNAALEAHEKKKAKKHKMVSLKRFCRAKSCFKVVF